MEEANHLVSLTCLVHEVAAKSLSGVEFSGALPRLQAYINTLEPRSVSETRTKPKPELR